MRYKIDRRYLVNRNSYLNDRRFAPQQMKGTPVSMKWSRAASRRANHQSITLLH